ncbi:MAG: hypothetical protein ACM3ZU_13555 [Bacteroidota bacterium]
MNVARSREEFIEMFSDRITKANQGLRQGKRLDLEQNLPKTYLVEAHRFREQEPNHNTVLRFLRATLNAPRQMILETKDEFFFAVKLDNVILYIDALETRFWLAHTLNRTLDADSSVESLIRDSPDLDSAWLPGKYLRGEKYGAVNERLGVRFDPVGSRLAPTEVPIPVELQRPTSIEVEAPDIDYIWRVLLEDEKIRRRMPIVRTIVRREFDESRYARIGLRYDGKITARGPTYPEYIRLVTAIQATYAQSIRQIEERYVLRWESVDGSETGESPMVAELRGAPISIEFTRPPIDTGMLISWLLHPNGPCRLWGHVERVAPDYYSIEAVDMHSGDPLGIELGVQGDAAFMRIYLAECACANIVARLYTNTQQHVDPCARVYGGDGAELFW